MLKKSCTTWNLLYYCITFLRDTSVNVWWSGLLGVRRNSTSMYKPKWVEEWCNFERDIQKNILVQMCKKLRIFMWFSLCDVINSPFPVVFEKIWSGEEVSDFFLISNMWNSWQRSRQMQTFACYVLKIIVVCFWFGAYTQKPPICLRWLFASLRSQLAHQWSFELVFLVGVVADASPSGHVPLHPNLLCKVWTMITLRFIQTQEKHL